MSLPMGSFLKMSIRGRSRSGSLSAWITVRGRFQIYQTICLMVLFDVARQVSGGRQGRRRLLACPALVFPWSAVEAMAQQFPNREIDIERLELGIFMVASATRLEGGL